MEVTVCTTTYPSPHLPIHNLLITSLSSLSLKYSNTNKPNRDEEDPDDFPFPLTLKQKKGAAAAAAAAANAGAMSGPSSPGFNNSTVHTNGS
jgi:hypothetical protein